VGIATDEEILAGAEPGTSATAQLILPVPPGSSAQRFADAMRRAVSDLAEGSLALDVAGSSEFGSLIGREGRIVRVEVSARTLEEATRWADSARNRLRALPTLADVREAQEGMQPVVEVTLARDRIAERGLTIESVASALAGGLGGWCACGRVARNRPAHAHLCSLCRLRERGPRRSDERDRRRRARSAAR
jgi:multidrug efflux pump subunit AcrB